MSNSGSYGSAMGSALNVVLGSPPIVVDTPDAPVASVAGSYGSASGSVLGSVGSMDSLASLAGSSGSMGVGNSTLSSLGSNLTMSPVVKVFIAILVALFLYFLAKSIMDKKHSGAFRRF